MHDLLLQEKSSYWYIIFMLLYPIMYNTLLRVICNANVDQNLCVDICPRLKLNWKKLMVDIWGWQVSRVASKKATTLVTRLILKSCWKIWRRQVRRVLREWFHRELCKWVAHFHAKFVWWSPVCFWLLSLHLVLLNLGSFHFLDFQPGIRLHRWSVSRFSNFSLQFPSFLGNFL